jgi:hypothetical protein
MEMTSIILNTKKRVYSTPIVEIIQLDNEISLLLSSLDSLPNGPGCNTSNSPENYDENPY